MIIHLELSKMFRGEGGGEPDVIGWALCKEGLRTTYLIKYKDVWVCTMIGDPDSIRSVDLDPEY